MADVQGEYPVPGPRTLDRVLGFRLLEVGEDTATAEASNSERVCQRFGLVHRGVYPALAEMLAAEATVHHVWPAGNRAMGLSNNTSFLRPIISGTIHAVGCALHRGRTTWVWNVDLRDDAGSVCAMSRVTIGLRRR
jgi:1,4-dihydroxy-2-naphthoyl-CoA hydrolase